MGVAKGAGMAIAAHLQSSKPSPCKSKEVGHSKAAKGLLGMSGGSPAGGGGGSLYLQGKSLKIKTN